MSLAGDSLPHTARGPAPRVRRGRGRRALIGSVLLGAVLVACSGETGTEVVPDPADLIRVSAAADTVEVGQATDPPMAVRVENSLGEPVEGVPVRFLLASGPGEVSPNLQVSNEQGVAEAEFRTGSEIGASRVRVDVPSATNVPSLRFELSTIPAGEVRLEVVDGADQEAEVGSQLPLPFRLEATTPSGTPTGGVTVAWEQVETPEGARLASDTTFTDDEGRTGNLLTLGDRPVDHVVRAWALGEGLVTDTVEVEAAALAELSGEVRLDSVSPVPLQAGGEAVLHGEGFGARAENVEVRVEGLSGTVTGVGDGRVQFRVPAFEGRCLPDREVGVRALVRGQPSNGLLQQMDAGHRSLDLAVGETRTLQGEAATRCLQIGASEEPREYLLAAGTASQAAGSRIPLRLLLRAETDTASASTAAEEGREGRRRPGSLELDDRHRAEGELRTGAVRALNRAGLGRVVAGRRQGRDVRTEAGGGTPSVGDTTRFSFAVGDGLSVSCEDTDRTVEGVTRAVGESVLLVEDTAAPSGGFTDTDWIRLRDEFDRVVMPTDSAYFGGPADLDGNGRVIVLFTPRVNQLSSRSSAARLGGFFLPLDLVDSGDPEGDGLQGPEGQVCPASNEGEVLYVAAPDPAGRFSRPLSRTAGLRLARTITSHELEHLLSAQQRLVHDGGSFDRLGTAWLQEGLAHLAEEVVGLRLAELGVGRNLTWEETTGDRRRLELFNTFHLNNFTRLNFFLLDPTAAPTLAPVDPGGLEGLQMRGFSWAFVRWLADRTGGDERQLFRRLSRGGAGHEQGVANVAQATGERWDRLLSDFLMALPVDDAELEGEAADRGLASWHLPSIFEALARNPGTRTQFPRSAPLQPTRLPFGNASVGFETAASSASYFQLRDSGDGQVLALRLASQSGGSVPTTEAPLIGVVRLR